MARGHARIKTSIWKDEHFVARSPEAQRVYFMLLSQPGLSFCGVIAYTGRRWASLAKGTTAKSIARAVDELAGAEFVVLDEDHEELWVRSFVRHDGVLSGGPKLHSAMWKDFTAIASPMIRRRFLDSLPADIREGAPDDPSDTPSEGAPDNPSDTDPDDDEIPHRMPRGRARPHPSSPIHPAPAPADEHESSSKHESVGNTSAEEESRVAQAVLVVAQRRLVQRLAVDVVERYGPVNDRDEWLRRTSERIRAGHQGVLVEMAAEGVNVEAMVVAIEPLSSPPNPDAPDAQQWPAFEWALDEDGFAVERRVSA